MGNFMILQVTKFYENFMKNCRYCITLCTLSLIIPKFNLSLPISTRLMKDFDISKYVDLI